MLPSVTADADLTGACDSARTGCATWAALSRGIGPVSAGSLVSPREAASSESGPFVLVGSRGLRTRCLCVRGGCRQGCAGASGFPRPWEWRVMELFARHLSVTDCGRENVCVSGFCGCAFPFTFQHECGCERA